jgi:hypothetical protein
MNDSKFSIWTAWAFRFLQFFLYIYFKLREFHNIYCWLLIGVNTRNVYTNFRSYILSFVTMWCKGTYSFIATKLNFCHWSTCSINSLIFYVSVSCRVHNQIIYLYLFIYIYIFLLHLNLNKTLWMNNLLQSWTNNFWKSST